VDITVKQLQIFQAVVVAGSITKASRRIGLSQPSISQQLAKLEETLGSQLMVRNRTGVINLTPAGEYWFKHGDELLRRLDGMIAAHRQRFVDSSVYVRMGVTPTLRSRFVAAAARIASEQPGFVKFDLRFALTSDELVEQLKLHQLNFAIVNRDAIADDLNSFRVAELFEDPVGWIVPAAITAAEIRTALSRKNSPSSFAPALRNFVEVDINVPLRAKTSEWYRHNLPGAAPAFSTNNYVTAVDLVAEGLATTHSPLSLVPNLPATMRDRVRIIVLESLTRTPVLAMPKHLWSLSAYATIFTQLVEFCRTQYNPEMLVGETTTLEQIRLEPEPEVSRPRIAAKTKGRAALVAAAISLPLALRRAGGHTLGGT
jgi:DNA-binding transcriptional LysR family regulator